jgi:hypothetical protein
VVGVVPRGGNLTSALGGEQPNSPPSTLAPSGGDGIVGGVMDDYEITSASGRKFKCKSDSITEAARCWVEHDEYDGQTIFHVKAPYHGWGSKGEIVDAVEKVPELFPKEAQEQEDKRNKEREKEERENKRNKERERLLEQQRRKEDGDPIKSPQGRGNPKEDGNPIESPQNDTNRLLRQIEENTRRTKEVSEKFLFWFITLPLVIGAIILIIQAYEF